MLDRRYFNPAICPTDNDWARVHDSFAKLVKKSDKTLGDILLKYFTKYEARMFVTQDRSDLKRIQSGNTERFRALLAERFNSVESSLITKLTMMYFGLPIEPVEAILDSETEAELQSREAEDSQHRPLKFLTHSKSISDDSPKEMRLCAPFPVRDEVEFSEPGLALTDGQKLPKTSYPHTGLNSNLPTIGKSVMTVKEQTELLQAFRDMRSIAMNRYYPCPFDGCKYQCRPGEEELTRAHFERTHMSQKCPFCDEPQYWWWGDEQKTRHLRQKHRNQLMEILGVRSANLVREDGTVKYTIPLKKVPERYVCTTTQPRATYPTNKRAREDYLPQLRRPVEMQERMEAYCEYCGRSCFSFLNQFERDYHDRLCKPTTFNGAKCTFCVVCGEPRWKSTEDAIKSQLSTGGLCACSHQETNVSGDYCKDCGVDTFKLPGHRSQHSHSCKGFSTQNGVFCAYCGEKLLKDGEQDVSAPHLKEHRIKCYRKLFVLRVEEHLAFDEKDEEDFIDTEPPSPPPSDSATDFGSVYKSDGDEKADAETERGRPRSRISKGKQPVTPVKKARSSLPKTRNKRKANQGKRQRSPSPDWNKELGEPDPGFVPDNSYYCSKCLRRVPKSTRPGRGQAMTTLKEEIESHTAKDRCCCIRNGIGSTKNLPNRSGWIPASKMSRIGKIKDKFLMAYPGYRKTIYPLQSSDYNSNMWRSDPNNKTNSSWWDIPWPPYVGQLPFPDGWKAPEDEGTDLGWETSEERVARSKSRNNSRSKGKGKGKGKTKKRPLSETYVTTQEENSSTEEVDEDPENYTLGGGRNKRRKIEDATYRPPCEVDPDSEEEIGEINRQLVGEDEMCTKVVTSQLE